MSLSNWLAEQIITEDSNIQRIIAVYPGRFQPFGPHHAKAFNWLQSQFGAENTYIVTSDKVKPPKSPFSFADKKNIITNYGIKNLVQTKQPYTPNELLNQFDPVTTAVVFMVGQKDMEDDPRFAMVPKKSGDPSYFQPYAANKNKLQGYNKHGYLIVAPHVSLRVPGYGEMSGTELRTALKNSTPTAFKTIMGWYNPTVYNMIKKNLTEEVAPNDLFSKMKTRFKDFVQKVNQEKEETKQAFGLIAQAAQGKRKLTPEEQKQVGEQMRDVLKTMGLGAATVLPGGTIYFLVIKLLKLEKYTMPSSFLGERAQLNEGGAGGHMAHPFDIPSVKTGKDLVKVFVQAANYLEKGPASVKIDGVNASIRLINVDGRRQFVMDRGSNKPLDVQGVTKADLEARFGAGHGMIVTGGKVLDIFNDAISDISAQLKSLGLWNNPNILFNIEYVAGSTNVLSYNKNFLAIHGLLEIEQVTPKRRATKEVTYNKKSMQDLLNNLAPTANEYGFEVLGSVPTTLDQYPDFQGELAKKYAITINGEKVSKTLNQWLSSARNERDTTVKLADGKSVGAQSKQILLALSQGEDAAKIVADPADVDKVVNGFVIYLATMELGNAVLEALSSPLGPVKEHEGIVIRDPKIYDSPFKITGRFIVKGLESQFR